MLRIIYRNVEFGDWSCTFIAAICNFCSIFSRKLLGQVNRNFVGTIYERYSMEIGYSFRSVRKNCWSISKYLAGEMDQSLLGSSYGRPSIKIRKQIFPPQAILVSGWYLSKNISHGTTWPNKNIILLEAYIEVPL